MRERRRRWKSRGSDPGTVWHERVFEERAPHERGFARYFERSVRPRLEGDPAALTGLRRSALKDAIRRKNAWIGFFASVAVAALVFFPRDEILGLEGIELLIAFGIVVAIYFVIQVAWLYRWGHRGRPDLRYSLIALMTGFFDGVEYRPVPTFDAAHFKSFRFLPWGTELVIEDEFAVVPDGTPVRACEVVLNNALWNLWTANRAMTVGIIFELAAPGGGELRCAVAPRNQRSSEPRDDPFLDRFQIACADEAQARAMLSPVVKERMIRLFDAFAAQEHSGVFDLQIGVRCAFRDGRWAVLVPSRGAPLQPVPAGDADDVVAAARAALADMHMIVQVADLIATGGGDLANVERDGAARRLKFVRRRAESRGDVWENPDGMFEFMGQTFDSREEAERHRRAAIAATSDTRHRHGV